MTELRGKAVSDSIKEELKGKLPELEKKLKRKPKLAIIRVGDNEADGSYARSAMKKVADFGMEAEIISFPEATDLKSFKAAVKKASGDEGIDGILILRPLPEHLPEKEIKEALSPTKDVDGMTEINQAKVFAGEEDGFSPCTAAAAVKLLKHYGVSPEGKNAVIVGRSAVVGKPLSMLLLSENATVTLCHSRTPADKLKELLKSADIIFLAVGKPGFLRAEHISEGAVVIDAGINVNEDGKLCGDADYEGIKDKCSMITPVPGGLGAVTTAVLCEHLFKAAEKKA